MNIMNVLLEQMYTYLDNIGYLWACVLLVTTLNCYELYNNFVSEKLHPAIIEKVLTLFTRLPVHFSFLGYTTF